MHVRIRQIADRIAPVPQRVGLGECAPAFRAFSYSKVRSSTYKYNSQHGIPLPSVRMRHAVPKDADNAAVGHQSRLDVLRKDELRHTGHIRIRHLPEDLLIKCGACLPVTDV